LQQHCWQPVTTSNIQWRQYSYSNNANHFDIRNNNFCLTTTMNRCRGMWRQRAALNGNNQLATTVNKQQ